MHNAYLAADTREDALQSSSTQNPEYMAAAETHQRTVAGSGPSASTLPQTSSVQSFKASSFSHAQSTERLGSWTESHTQFCSMGAVHSAIVWVSGIIAQLHNGLASTNVQAHDTMMALPAARTHPQAAACHNHLQSPSVSAGVCQVELAALDWLALSGVDLHNLSNPSGASTASIPETMDALLAALLTVLWADATPEYRGTGNAADRTVRRNPDNFRRTVAS